MTFYRPFVFRLTVTTHLLRLVFPQWQGSGKRKYVYEGAQLLKAISNRADKEHQGVTMGLLGSFNSAGRATGPIAGGVVYSVSMILPYVGSAAISLFSALLIIAWRQKDNGIQKTAKASAAEQ